MSLRGSIYIGHRLFLDEASKSLRPHEPMKFGTRPAGQVELVYQREAKPLILPLLHLMLGPLLLLKATPKVLDLAQRPGFLQLFGPVRNTSFRWGNLQRPVRDLTCNFDMHHELQELDFCPLAICWE